MTIDISNVFGFMLFALIIAIFVLAIVQLIRGVREEPIILRGKIVDMDVNTQSHTTKESEHASTSVNYIVRFVSDEGQVYQLSASKSLFLRVRPGDYGDAHIKKIFRQLLEFETVSSKSSDD